MKKLLPYILLFLVPGFASAQGAQGVKSVINTLGEIINAILPLLIAVAVLGFFYGLARYIFKAGDDAAQKEARTIMIWGILVIFVMVSVWGLVRVLQSTFGTALGDTKQPVDVPDAFKPKN